MSQLNPRPVYQAELQTSERVMSAIIDEASLERLKRDFITCQRQAMIGTLTGIIVHEYNNLMTPVLVRAQDAVSRNDVATMQKALTVTVQQTQKALDFSRQVVELTCGGEPPRQRCRLLELVEDAIGGMVRPCEKDGIELVVSVPDDLYIDAHPTMFVQVLMNLLLNARAAMAKQRGYLKITAVRVDDSIRIAVSDTGCGISPEVMDREINAFLSAGNEVLPKCDSKAGLGLLACRMITQLHGATLSATRNEGPGCTFQITWPAD